MSVERADHCVQRERPLSAGSVEVMDREELLTLLTPEAMRLLDELPPLTEGHDLVTLVSRLRTDGHSSALVAAVLAQANFRRKAATKFGPFADRMLFTDAGLQQATRLQVAAHHAARFRDAEVTAIADLGCGIGADSMAFATLGFEVRALDADEVTAAIATHNLVIFPNASVHHGTAESFTLRDDEAAWLDPARRNTERSRDRRSHDPADWSPSLDFAFGLGEVRPIGVKLGPGIPHEALPDDGEAQWVSVGGDVVEATVWRGGTEREGVRRSALLLPRGEGAAHELTASGPAPDAEVGTLGAYLHEPDGAVIRAELIGLVAAQLDGRMISPSIAWITSDSGASSPFVQSFRVIAELPLDAAKLKRELRARNIGRVEIKKRGVDVDPAAFRQRVQPKGDGEATLILTRLGERRRAILAERVTPASA